MAAIGVRASGGIARPLLVLIANDQEWSARSLETILGPEGYAVLRTYTSRQTLDLAHRVAPDVVMVDARLPDGDAFELCRTLRDESYLGSATPILITSSDPGHRGQLLAAYEAGAWDYVLLPLDGEVLLHKMRTFAAVKREADRLRDEGLLDPATGLYNARGLARRAREIGAEASRRRDALACVAIIPAPESGAAFADAQSEEVVSRVAEQLGGLLRRTGRSSDAVGRLGRTEFAIIAPATEAEGAQRLAERVRAAVDAARISITGGGGRMSDSGVAQDAVESADTAEEGLRHLGVRIGYYAVPDFAESAVDAVEMVVRAADALRQSLTSGVMASPIQAFVEPIAASVR
jgi:two-component system cell cycle response regulator